MTEDENMIGDIPTPPPEQEIEHLAEQCATLLRENERLRNCHRIIQKQIAYYKPDLPDYTKVEIHLGVLRAAVRCAGTAPWELED